MRTTDRAKRPNLRLRLRTSEWERHTQSRGLPNNNACADLLGISASTIRRARNNEVEPSETFVKAAIFHLPGLKFEDIFEVVIDGKSGGA